MFTTDGAVPSFYAERGVIGGCLRIATGLGLDPMRALQMATIDPATFLGLDEQLGGIAPGRHATLNVLPAIGEWRPGAGRSSTAEIVARDGELVAALPELAWPAGPGLVAPDASAFAPLTGVQPVARYESAVINRRADRDADGLLQAALVGRDGTWITKGVIDNFLDVDGFATTATTSLELLVLGRDPAAMARAAARVADMGGGFAFDGGWSAPLEIDGLIADGGYDRALAIERELTAAMRAHGYPFHDPLYSLLFALRRLPAGAPVDPVRRDGGQIANDRHESVTN